MYSCLHGDLPLTETEFIESAEEKETIISSLRDNRIAFVTLSRMSPDADILEVLINKKTISWNGSKTQFFVFYNYTCRNTENLNVINSFLRFFVRQTPEVLLSLTERKSSDIVEFVMNEGMKSESTGI